MSFTPTHKTDSIYMSALPLIDEVSDDDDVMMEKILKIAGDVQEYINGAYDYYAKKFHNVSTHKFKIKQETIASAAFWVAKKRYAQKIRYREGVKLDEVDVKGLDSVRSDFPPAFRDFMDTVLKDILDAVDKKILDDKVLEFRTTLDKFELFDIMFPTGIKDIKKYEVKSKLFFTPKGCPVHVKSAINYNSMLKHKNILHVESIRNGDKIKWIYLKSNDMNLETIAVKGYGDPPEILEFIKTHINYEKAFESKLKRKLEDFYKSLGWGLIPENVLVEKFFEF